MLNKLYNKNMMVAILVICVIIVLIIVNYKSNEVEIITEVQEEKITEENNIVENNKIIVHVTGCVVNSGVIEIDEGARIVDVIKLAGGITEEADISKVNLAYKVKDAQKIYIPSIYDDEVEYITIESGKNVIVDDINKGEGKMVNINTATQTELETLSGIGPSTALKIINYREENGNFNSIEEIKQVPGIGDSKFDNIKDMIEV